LEKYDHAPMTLLDKAGKLQYILCHHQFCDLHSTTQKIHVDFEMFKEISQAIPALYQG